MKPPKEDFSLSRRDLFRAGAGLAAVAGLAQTSEAAAAESMMGVKFTPSMTVRMGIIGTGGRGSSMLENFLAVDNLTVNALCDTVKEKALKAQAKVEKSGQ